MADKPTGPVKPPVLDLKARKPQTEPEPSRPGPEKSAAREPGKVAAATSNDKPKPDPKPAEKPSATTQPPLREKPAATQLPLAPLAAAVLGGAALGLAAAYGLAVAGFWPSSSPATDLSPLEARIAAIESSQQSGSATIEDLSARIVAVETAPAPELPALPENLVTGEALADITSQIEALGLRIDAVAAGIPADESAELAAEITRLGSGLATLETRLETLEAQSANQATLDAMRTERDRFAALPAATAALQSAMTIGAPFGAELAAVEALAPEIGVGDAARATATSGVKPMRTIAGEFRALIPNILAARPQNPDAPWFASLLDQAASAVALRPVDETADTPEAVVGRIELALESDDPAAARTLILSLPQEMQNAASSVRTDLDAVIAARALLADFRALTPQSSEEASQ